ncbi:MAG: aminotransferase class V-fold PLP-dependent enzyme [Pseudomonas sp.]
MPTDYTAATAEECARDEEFWAHVAARYQVEPGPINLENGYFGRMTRSVVEDYQRNIADINASNSVYVRYQFDEVDSQLIREQLAAMVEVPCEEIALTRCASESLQTLIRNYNALQPGDQVLICDLDYISVQSSMRWLAKSRGVEVIEIQMPHPATYESLLESYRAAFERHPRLKLMALTHVTHRTGLVMPVQAIAAMAKARSIDVILDGAHALGQLEFKLEELGVAFAGYNLQKWIGAPLSLGFIYIAKERLSAIDPDMGDSRYADDDILGRAPYGTPNIPALLSLPRVFDEHQALGGAAIKGARLKYLRDLWVKPVRGLAGIEVLTPDDPRLYCGITAFRFTGLIDQQPMVKRLLEEYNLFTVVRYGAACGECIRITPGFTTTTEQIETLVWALQTLSQA